MTSFKNWKQKASTWLKRALIIAAIAVGVFVATYFLYVLYVGSRKQALRNQITELQTELQSGSASAQPSMLEQLLVAKLLTSPAAAPST